MPLAGPGNVSLTGWRCGVVAGQEGFEPLLARV